MWGDEDTRGWLGTVVPIDPVLKGPLDIYGSGARRITLAKSMLEALGFAWDHRERLSGPTYVLAFDMLEPLADALSTGRVSLRERSTRIAARTDIYDRDVRGLAGARALIDIGWHTHIPGGDAREVVRSLGDAYVREMASRVYQMLRRWETKGFVRDAAA